MPRATPFGVAFLFCPYVPVVEEALPVGQQDKPKRHSSDQNGHLSNQKLHSSYVYINEKSNLLL